MMQKSHVLALCFSSLLSVYAIAETQITDESDNVMILDEQQATQELPVAQESLRDSNSEEKPFAQDDDLSATNDVDFIDQIQQLQKDVQELRGQLDIQTHELTLLRQQQLSFYNDLSTQINRFTVQKTVVPSIDKTSLSNLDDHQKIPKAIMSIDSESTSNKLDVSVTSNSIPKMPSARINPVNEQINYLAAYDLVKSRQYDNALVAMQNFVNRYPDGGYTANAHYWLGELYLVKKDYVHAIKQFDIVLKKFPSSSKSAACALKIGYALAACGKKMQAIQQLRNVVKNYPNTPTAQLAASKITIINES
jgi:tol-pal system protein YbgF